ncbi:MAG: hypothetical protein WD709_00215 [Gammaproteobacteria bacterium]
MNSSVETDKSEQIQSGDGPITGKSFYPDKTIVAPDPSRDPYEQFIELMEVVEALCPKWPERPTFKDSDIFLL